MADPLVTNFMRCLTARPIPAWSSPTIAGMESSSTDRLTSPIDVSLQQSSTRLSAWPGTPSAVPISIE